MEVVVLIDVERDGGALDCAVAQEVDGYVVDDVCSLMSFAARIDEKELESADTWLYTIKAISAACSPLTIDGFGSVFVRI